MHSITRASKRASARRSQWPKWVLRQDSFAVGKDSAMDK
jgi:hypothetical protein